MFSETESVVPNQVLKWVIDSAGSDVSVESIQRMHGGTSSIVYSISLKKNQSVKPFVFRQFDNVEWLSKEPDLAVHEAESLRWATRTGLQTPEIVAFDETGSKCGVPAVLMTQLEGSVTLKPHNLDQWVNGMAESLVKIHSVEADDFPWSYFTYNNITSLETPSWSTCPELWNRAIHIVKEPHPVVKQCFIHRDYHPTNILWKDNVVSGVVDWVNACKGPAGIDLGHCRLNLAMLYGVHTADAFKSAYQHLAGSAFSYEPYWDILSLIEILDGPPKVYPGWIAFGVTGLTDEMMNKRLDQYLKTLL
jgi:aminoglycoside phosphotransferase (APT) family kinase protein